MFSRRTLAQIQFDLLRLRARYRKRTGGRAAPASPRLHFGCGPRRVPGWLNVDVTGSEHDVDLASAVLPWSDASFEAIAGQHVIEHLELATELIPLLKEFRRVLRAGGELWVSAPDIEKLCRSYLEHDMRDLIEDRVRRSRLTWVNEWSLDAESGLAGTPPSHMINAVFFQRHEHRNLFDLPLLDWTLRQAGFSQVDRVEEAAFLARFPEFPPRYDDAISIYVVAR